MAELSTADIVYGHSLESVPQPWNDVEPFEKLFESLLQPCFRKIAKPAVTVIISQISGEIR
jgi:hypothetical protein